MVRLATHPELRTPRCVISRHTPPHSCSHLSFNRGPLKHSITVQRTTPHCVTSCTPCKHVIWLPSLLSSLLLSSVPLSAQVRETVVSEGLTTYVVDNRQENHEWGPWMWVAGSYAEPLQSDENSESWDAMLMDPHTDRLSA